MLLVYDKSEIALCISCIVNLESIKTVYTVSMYNINNNLKFMQSISKIYYIKDYFAEIVKESVIKPNGILEGSYTEGELFFQL